MLINRFMGVLNRTRYLFVVIIFIVIISFVYLAHESDKSLSLYITLPWKGRIGDTQVSLDQDGTGNSGKEAGGPNKTGTNYTITLDPDTQKMGTATTPYIPAAMSPGAAKDKVVVTGKMQDEDTSWIQEKLPDWTHAVYTIVDDSSSVPGNSGSALDASEDTQFILPSGKGRESLPYLTYIVQHYEKLPELIVFIHPHESGWPVAWHTEGNLHSNSRAISRLNAALVAKMGYVNFRCTHQPGCPIPLHPHDLSPNGREPQPHLLRAWQEIFPNVEPPKDIAAACCAQFAVAKWRVLERPKSDYERMRNWLYETDLEDDVSGRVFEYLWHIIFRRPSVDCPTQKECFCKVYNTGCRRWM